MKYVQPEIEIILLNVEVLTSEVSSSDYQMPDIDLGESTN